MPYLNCPSCRLVVRSASADSAQDCPRCSTRLSKRPRRLFVVDLPRDIHGQLARDLTAHAPADAGSRVETSLR